MVILTRVDFAVLRFRVWCWRGFVIFAFFFEIALILYSTLSETYYFYLRVWFLQRMRFFGL